MTRRQRQGESVREVINDLKDLLKRVDPDGTRKQDYERLNYLYEALHPEIALQVKSRNPANFNDACTAAIDVEDDLIHFSRYDNRNILPPRPAFPPRYDTRSRGQPSLWQPVFREYAPILPPRAIPKTSSSRHRGPHQSLPKS
jgi:hypothetical protein